MEYIVETTDITKEFKRTEKTPQSEYIWITGLKDALLSKLRREARDTFLAVDHVSLKVRRSELFGLVGPNGAGKTTLIKLMSGILKPDEGTAIVNGFDIRKDPKNAHRQVSMIPSGAGSVSTWRYRFERILTSSLPFMAGRQKLPKKSMKL